MAWRSSAWLHITGNYAEFMRMRRIRSLEAFKESAITVSRSLTRSMVELKVREAAAWVSLNKNRRLATQRRSGYSSLGDPQLSAHAFTCV